MRLHWNNDWRFTPDFTHTLIQEDIQDLEAVRLPHTSALVPLNYFDEKTYQKDAGYVKTFQADPAWRGQKVLLTIDGACHHAEVFLNGQRLAEHDSGYTAFTVDLSDYLDYEKENRLLIRVDSHENRNIPPFGHVVDYMTFGGITRGVFLDILNPVHIEDAFVSARRRNDHWVLCTDLQLSESANVTLKQTLKDPQGRIVYADARPLPMPWRQNKARAVISVKEPALWSPEQPALYTLELELWRNGRKLDAKTVRTAFREAEFRADGFWLNGKKLKLRGLNRHQAYPYIGYAAPASLQRFDAEQLKALGLNAVRTSHYPQSQAFIDRCDELGLLVFTEFPGWQHIGDEAWKNQALLNLKEMILQYRNHPSIILWGVRINESEDDDAFYRATNRLAHPLDPTRQTGGVRNLKNSHLLEDVYTYNDFSHNGRNAGCLPRRKVTADTTHGYLITEYNGHMFPTKSFDDEEHRLGQALRHAAVIDAVAGEEDIAGSFGWCFADYNTHKEFGAGDRICYHGVLDMFRNPKPAASVYQALQEDTPVLDVFSSMDMGDHPEAVRGPVWMATNADTIRTYRNGARIRDYHTNDSPYPNLAHGLIRMDAFIGDDMAQEEHLEPRIAAYARDILNDAAVNGPYHLSPASLAKAGYLALKGWKLDDAFRLNGKYIGNWGASSLQYIFESYKDGRLISRVIKEPVKEIHLELLPSHTALKEAESYDMALIRVQAKDQNDNRLWYLHEAADIELEGPFELIGPERLTLIGGSGGFYVRTTGQSGKGEVRVRFRDQTYSCPLSVTTEESIAE